MPDSGALLLKALIELESATDEELRQHGDFEGRVNVVMRHVRDRAKKYGFKDAISKEQDGEFTRYEVSSEFVKEYQKQEGVTT